MDKERLLISTLMTMGWEALHCGSHSPMSHGLDERHGRQYCVCGTMVNDMTSSMFVIRDGSSREPVIGSSSVPMAHSYLTKALTGSKKEGPNYRKKVYE